MSSTSHNTPPRVPEVTDEAADTPAWVPRLGLVLAVLCILWVVWSHDHAGGRDDVARRSAGMNAPSTAADQK